MIPLVIAIFSVWFLVCAVYIFQPTWLGQSKHILHVLGWASSWSMFVHKENAHFKGTFNVLYKDFVDHKSTSEWITLLKVKWQPTSFILGLGVRDETVIRFLVKGALKKFLADGNSLTSANTNFNTLCRMVLTHDRASNITSRKIKIEYYASQQQTTLVVESEELAIV
ncbi:MAG: hypothetical protein ACJAXX_001306 [Roseivirga sp.]|jgi:hypothetical protein